MNASDVLNKPGLRWGAVFLLAILAFVAGAVWRGGRLTAAPRQAVAAVQVVEEGTEAGPAPAAQIYTCSMHPQVRSPDPDDKCPICAMALIPVPADDGGGEEDGEQPRLRLSEGAIARMEIRTWPVARRPVELELDLFGKVGFDESRLYDVVARTEAYVEKLIVNTPWQPLAAGETVAEFYSPAAVTAMSELLVARENASPAMLEAGRARLQRLGMTAGQIETVETSGELPRTFRIESPATGVVLEIAAREGEWLREGGRLLRIADLSRVWINLEAYERDLGWLGVGQATTFVAPSLPGRTFTGTVTFIEPVLNERSRTTRLRVEADNADGLLKPGMFVSARVLAPASQAAEPLVIPATAPLLTGRRAIVYVRLPAGDRPTFEPRQVALGVRAGDVYLVESGLVEGELVVVNGQFKIDSELQIRGLPSMMTAGGADSGAEKPLVEGGELKLQTHCPVMGGEINSDYFVDVEGYRIYVCCPGCDTAILADPSRYLEEMKAAGVTPYRLQTHCPIMGGPIDRDSYHDHNGQRIYVCCPGCLDQVREKAEAIIEEHRRRGIVFEKVDP